MNKKRVIALIIAVFAALFTFYILTAPNESKTPETQTTTGSEVVKEKSPEDIFNSICEQYGGVENCIYTKTESGEWAITQLIQPQEDSMLFSSAKQISRDFIFAVYATNLPVAHASITITMPNKYYRAGLGADVASTQSATTWTSNEVGPTIFYDFLKSSGNGSAGDGKNSTYIETNLE